MREILYSPWQTMGLPFALKLIGQLHQLVQSSPLPDPGDLGRCPSIQSHVTRTYRDVWDRPNAVVGVIRGVA